MSQASNYLENALQDVIFNGGSLSGITPFLALYTSNPSDDDSGTEVSGTAYARVDISTSFPNASGTSGVLQNDADIVFATAGAGGWGTITHIGGFDASSGGNLLVYGALTAGTAIAEGDIFKIPTGSFTATVA